MISRLTKTFVMLALAVLVIKLLKGEDLLERLNNLGAIGWMYWLVLVSLSVLIFGVIAAMFQASLTVIGLRVPFHVSFNYSAMNTFLNSVLPAKGGIIVRGAYLKKRFNVSWTKYFFVVATGQLINISLLLLFFFLVSLTSIQHYPHLLSTLEKYLPWFALVLPLIIITVILGFCKNQAVNALLLKVKRGYKLWVSNPRTLVWYILLTLFLHALSCFRLWLAFSAIGYQLTLIEIILLYSVVTLGLTWAITPGNIGVKEAAIVLVGSIIGIDSGAALTASLLDRAASMIVILIVGGSSTYIVSAK